MKARGSYKPKNYEYEVLHDGTAIIRLYENVKKYTEKGKDGQPDATGWEYDRYALSYPHSDRLQRRVEGETEAWLEFAKQEEARELAAGIRAKRDGLLRDTDITQLPDADICEDCREAFRGYRQLLREVPEQPGFPYAVDWPEKPAAMKRTR
jgi:hypothetical protein